MQKAALVLMLLVMTLGLFGCPSQPTTATKSGPVYSDPDAARARDAERTRELDTNIQK